MNWFRHHGLGFHAGDRLAFAIVILLPGIALLTLVIWLLTPVRNNQFYVDR